MHTRLRKYWPIAKWLFTIAVLVFVGRHFAHDLSKPELWQRPMDFGWLVVAGLLYLAGLGMSALYWLALLRRMNQTVDLVPAVRAYYLGHFGKYVPGKAWALIMRVGLARSAGVSVGVGIVTTFYEVMVTMTAGALTAAVLFALSDADTTNAFDLSTIGKLLAFQEFSDAVDGRVLSLLSLGLVVIVGLPLIPAVFNRLVRRISAPFREANSEPPAIPFVALPQGLLLTACGWCLHGASLWAVVRGVSGVAIPFNWEAWSWFTAALSVAYVLGFVVVLVPNGLGVREYFLTVLLVPHLMGSIHDASEARAVTVLAVIVLRVVWTAAELVLAPLLYWLPQIRGQVSGARGQGTTPDASVDLY